MRKSQICFFIFGLLVTHAVAAPHNNGGIASTLVDHEIEARAKGGNSGSNDVEQYLHELEEIEKSMGLVDGGKRKSDIDGKIYIWDRLAHGIWKARAEKKPKVIINFQEKMSKIKISPALKLGGECSIQYHSKKAPVSPNSIEGRDPMKLSKIPKACSTAVYEFSKTTIDEKIIPLGMKSLKVLVDVFNSTAAGHVNNFLKHPAPWNILILYSVNFGNWYKKVLPSDASTSVATTPASEHNHEATAGTLSLQIPAPFLETMLKSLEKCTQNNAESARLLAGADAANAQMEKQGQGIEELGEKLEQLMALMLGQTQPVASNTVTRADVIIPEAHGTTTLPVMWSVAPVNLCKLTTLQTITTRSKREAVWVAERARRWES